MLPSPLHAPSQSAVHQRIRGEGKQEKTFTKHTTISKSTSYHKRQISSTVNSICTAVNPIHHHREHKKTKAFTPYTLYHNHLRHTGEEVKAKNENLLTRARTREGKKPCIRSEKERHTQGSVESRARRSENGIGVRMTTLFNRARTCRWVRLPAHGASCRAHPY